VAFDHAIEFGIDPGELLVVQIHGRAQFADLAVHFVDLLLQFGNVSAAIAPQPAQLVFQAQNLLGNLPAPALTKCFGDGLIESSDGQRLRLDFAGCGALPAPVKEFLDLVPSSNQEK
jgi:hypothetical protein